MQQTDDNLSAIAELRFGQASITCPDDGGDWHPQVWGWFIGPFIVWDANESGFNVTHVATGYAVQKGIPEQARALVLAARLAPLADWSFTDPAAARDWPPEIAGPISVLRVWARNEEVEDPFGFVGVAPLEESSRCSDAMRSDTTQLDIIRHSDQGMAEAFRVAADTARRNPFEAPDRAEERARIYEQQAAEHEARARGQA